MREHRAETREGLTGDTALLQHERRKLRRSLFRFDVIFLIVAAMFVPDTIAQISTNGPQALTWLVIVAATFLIPYGLVMAELGSTFPLQGGLYEWVKLAFGRLWAGMASILYWVINPVWIGGSLAFVSAEAVNAYVFPIAPGSASDYAFKLAFVWLAVGVTLLGTSEAKWFMTVGSVAKIVLVAVFAVTTAVYAATNGVAGFPAGGLTPTVAGLFGLAPLLLFALVGFEVPAAAGEEARDPQRDVPRAVAIAGSLSAACYAIPILLLLLVIPADKITGLGGFIDAVAEIFSVYGAAAPVLVGVVAVLFIATLVVSAAAWTMAANRVQAVAAADGAFFAWFGVLSERSGAPVRVGVFTGIFASLFTVASNIIFQMGTAATFGVVLSTALITSQLTYVIVFPSAIALRRRFPSVSRPYRVPGGNLGLTLATVLITSWMVLGAWTALFPGTLEPFFGLPYDFKESWGVSRTQFEVFALGTLAVVVLAGLAGYAASGRVRAQRGAAVAEDPEIQSPAEPSKDLMGEPS